MRKSFVLLISVVLLFGISFASLAGDINMEAVLVQEPPVVYTGSSLAITVKAEEMGVYHAQSWHFSNNLWGQTAEVSIIIQPLGSRIISTTKQPC